MDGQWVDGELTDGELMDGEASDKLMTIGCRDIMDHFFQTRQPSNPLNNRHHIPAR
jgi:hypothetical protein